MWKQAAFYGVLLAVGTLVLQWLDYQRLARAYSGEIYAFLIAVAFWYSVCSLAYALTHGDDVCRNFSVGVLVSLVTAGLLRNSRFLPARRA